MQYLGIAWLISLIASLFIWDADEDSATIWNCISGVIILIALSILGHSSALGSIGVAYLICLIATIVIGNVNSMKVAAIWSWTCSAILFVAYLAVFIQGR